jgi:PIN domain nuclease of toxin-antitoxin system
MRYLLDTHMLIWFQEDNPNIPKPVMQLLQHGENQIFFSQVSLFEIAIKQTIGKLPHFTATVMEVYEQALKDDFLSLPLHNKHIAVYNSVPLLAEHRDPFDRLLLATAHAERLTVVTADKNFSLYPDFVKTEWNDL